MKWLDNIPKSVIVCSIGALLISIGVGRIHGFSAGCIAFGSFLIIAAYIAWLTS